MGLTDGQMDGGGDQTPSTDAYVLATGISYKKFNDKQYFVNCITYDLFTVYPEKFAPRLCFVVFFVNLVLVNLPIPCTVRALWQSLSISNIGQWRHRIVMVTGAIRNAAC